MGAQLQENQISSLPEGPWPASLETLFIQQTKITSLPKSLEACKLKRLNIGKLNLDGEADALASKLSEMVLKNPDGIWWGKDGQMQRSK